MKIILTTQKLMYISQDTIDDIKFGIYHINIFEYSWKDRIISGLTWDYNDYILMTLGAKNKYARMIVNSDFYKYQRKNWILNLLRKILS